MTKNGQTISFILGLFITVVFLFIASRGAGNLAEGDYSTNIFNFGIYAALVLIILSAAGMIFFIFFNIIINFKGNIKLLIGLGVILILFAAMYFSGTGGHDAEMAGPLGEYLKSKPKLMIDKGENGFITGGMWTGIILTIVAFASFIILEVLNFFK